MDTIIAAVRRVAELQQAVADIDAIVHNGSHGCRRTRVFVVSVGPDGVSREVELTLPPAKLYYALIDTRAARCRELFPLLKVLERTERDLEGSP